jgi:imidazolonepropionase-like amidohydrolase
VGKNADVLVLKGDPAARIADVENVEIVFKAAWGTTRRSCSIR